MKDRITEFLVKENISPAEFADKIGVQRSSVSHVLNGRNYPGASFLQKMLTSYRSLNPRWLLLGEGSMMDIKKPVEEPSLFSNTLIGEVIVEKKQHLLKNENPPVDGNNNFSEKIEREIETISPKTNIKDTKTDLNVILDKIIDSKEIEKIVLFYHDKTFSVYTPSK